MSTGPGWFRLEEKTKFYQMDKLDTKSFLSYRKQDYTRSEYYNDFLMFNIQRKLHMQASRESFIQKYFSVATTL